MTSARRLSTLSLIVPLAIVLVMPAQVLAGGAGTIPLVGRAQQDAPVGNLHLTSLAGSTTDSIGATAASRRPVVRETIVRYRVTDPSGQVVDVTLRTVMEDDEVVVREIHRRPHGKIEGGGGSIPIRHSPVKE